MVQPVWRSNRSFSKVFSLIQVSGASATGLFLPADRLLSSRFMIISLIGLPGSSSSESLATRSNLRSFASKLITSPLLSALPSSLIPANSRIGGVFAVFLASTSRTTTGDNSSFAFTIFLGKFSAPLALVSRLK